MEKDRERERQVGRRGERRRVLRTRRIKENREVYECKTRKEKGREERSETRK